MKTKESFLQRVKQQKNPKGKYFTEISEEELQDVSLAWVKDEVRLSAILAALGIPKTYGGNTLYKIAMGIRSAYRSGRITIN